MKKTDAKRRVIVETIADYLLAHGMKGASLRPMAAAVGTSDRMLLHYFKDKEELLTAALLLITQRLISILDSARPESMPYQNLMFALAATVKDPNVQPYLRLALELVALAAGGDAAAGETARQIYCHFYEWLASVLKVDQEEDREPLASLALATIEGMVLLNAIGLDSRISAALKGLAGSQ